MERALSAEREGETAGWGLELEELRARHGAIERRLSELERHLSLTPEEQIERARLKKEKLAAKDKMALLAARRASGA